MRTKTITGFLLVSALSLPALASADLPQYQVMRTTGKITIDGILDEADWAAAKPVGDFQFPWWKSGDKEQTEAKMLWDDTFLYVAFFCYDKHIWADHWDTNSATCPIFGMPVYQFQHPGLLYHFTKKLSEFKVLAPKVAALCLFFKIHCRSLPKISPNFFISSPYLPQSPSRCARMAASYAPEAC